MNLRKWCTWLLPVLPWLFFGCHREDEIGSHLISQAQDALGPETSPQSMVLTVMDVGQGDAFALQSARYRDQGIALVDAGPPNTRWDTLIQAFGLQKIAALYLTHPDADHIGGAVNLMRLATIEKIFIASRTAFQTTSTGQALLELARAKGIALDTLRAGQNRPLHGGLLEVLWPPPDTAISGNDGSLVMRWVDAHGDPIALFMGDASLEVEGQLLRRQVDLQAPLLKVGHHGSRTSSRAGFLFAVKPNIAVIACDSLVFGHPHVEVLNALQQTMPGGLIWRTDRHGSTRMLWSPQGGWRGLAIDGF